MQSTPIKINTSPAGQNEPTKNILNLNYPLASPSANRGKQNKPTPDNKQKKYLWFLLALVLLEAGGIAWLYLTKPISPYFKLLPQNTIVSSYFNQTRLTELLNNGGDNWLSKAWSNKELKNILAKAKIDQPEQMLKLFDSQMALAIQSQNNDTGSTWLILATIKVPNDIFLQAQNKAEKNLKQNYNLISESYRQVAITQIKPLNQEQGSLFYAETKGYFMLADSNDVIEETIDKIIGR